MQAPAAEAQDVQPAGGVAGAPAVAPGWEPAHWLAGMP
jgi:hypothetical protein